MKPTVQQDRQAPQLPKHLHSATLAAIEDHAEYASLALSEADLAHQSATGVLFEQTRLRHVALTQTHLSRLRLIDTRFDACDLSAAGWEKAHIRRGELVGCRLLGTSLIEAQIEDVLVEDCNAEGALFVSARFRSVRFEHCTLRSASFAGADLRDVVFRECDLGQADLRGAKLKGTDLRGSTLEGMQVSAPDLRGAIVEPAQAVQVARLLGIVVEDL